MSTSRWINRAKRQKAALVGQRHRGPDRYATYIEKAEAWYVYPTRHPEALEAPEEKVQELLKDTNIELVHNSEELPKPLQNAVEIRLKREDRPDNQSSFEDF